MEIDEFLLPHTLLVAIECNGCKRKMYECSTETDTSGCDDVVHSMNPSIFLSSALLASLFTLLSSFLSLLDKKRKENAKSGP